MATPGQPTVAQIGKGTTVSYAAPGETPSWTPIAELQDLKMPTHETGTIAVERYDSPSTDPELIPSWGKPGSIDLKFTYSDDQSAALFALRGVPGQWKITKPLMAGQTMRKNWIYQGLITKFGDEVPLKDKMTCTVTFAISGPPIPGEE